MRNFKKGLKSFLNADIYLLEKKLNERAITHKLGEHLQKQFLTYDVDCEYNRNVRGVKYQKGITLLENDIRECLSKNFNKVPRRLVLPDVIIHKRDIFEENACIIEVKKKTKRVNDCYDRKKLQHYTKDESLRYDLGIFIVFNMPYNKSDPYSICFYQDGVVNSNLLKEFNGLECQ